MSVSTAPRLRGLLLRLRKAGGALHPQPQYHPQQHQQQLLPPFAIAIEGGATQSSSSSSAHKQQTRAKRTVRVVLKRDDPVTGARAGEVVRVAAGRQRLDLFPTGAADYATPRALREARAAAAALGGSKEDEAAAAAKQVEEDEKPADAAAADNDSDEASSLEQALQVLETKAVVLRRRGKPLGDGSSAGAPAAAAAAAADGDDGGGAPARLVGRVTRRDVARAVERQLGVALDDRLLLMGDEGIRAFGEYRVPLNVAAPDSGGSGSGSKKGRAAASGGGGRRQAHVRVDVVRTWR